jgi:lysophospholipase L1-like esterase
MVDRTCREVLRVSAGGSAVRLRLSNALNPDPLRIAAVTVAVRASGAAADPATVRPVTFDAGRPVTVAAGGVTTSDPVALRVTAGADVLVSLALPGSQRLPEHQHGVPGGYCTAPGTGDRTGEAAGAGFSDAGHPTLVVDDVDVATGATAPRTILAVGDSLTDARLWPGIYGRWSDVLTARLAGSAPVANAGVDGNRLVAPGGYGPTVVERFDRDVLGRAGIGTVVLLAGTNDITAGVSATEITSQLGALAGRAHDRGLRFVLMTLTPAHKRTPDKERVRQDVNRWIRTTKAVDRVVDADAVLRDPAQPLRLAPAYDFGDGLHLSLAGERALGEAVAAALSR